MIKIKNNNNFSKLFCDDSLFRINIMKTTLETFWKDIIPFINDIILFILYKQFNLKRISSNIMFSHEKWKLILQKKIMKNVKIIFYALNKRITNYNDNLKILA